MNRATNRAIDATTARSRTFWLTVLAMLAFAGNSLLCRLALRDTAIDAASFTALRLVSGALVLWLLLRLEHRAGPGQEPRASGNWASAAALFAYAACFSYAYISLSAATGALILFAAVQATMISVGLWRGERLGLRRTLGFGCALAGLVGLLMPGLTAPPLAGALLMLAAGIAWGIYSLRGRGATNALAVTAGNFVLAVPLSLLLLAGGALFVRLSIDVPGAVYALLSGALASGVGYVVWYAALRGLSATSAASVQLSVPVIAAAAGVVLLGEAVTPRLVLASIVILGGIALVVVERRPSSR